MNKLRIISLSLGMLALIISSSNLTNLTNLTSTTHINNLYKNSSYLRDPLEESVTPNSLLQKPYTLLDLNRPNNPVVYIQAPTRPFSTSPEINSDPYSILGKNLDIANTDIPITSTDPFTNCTANPSLNYACKLKKSEIPVPEGIEIINDSTFQINTVDLLDNVFNYCASTLLSEFRIEFYGNKISVDEFKTYMNNILLNGNMWTGYKLNLGYKDTHEILYLQVKAVYAEEYKILKAFYNEDEYKEDLTILETQCLGKAKAIAQRICSYTDDPYERVRIIYDTIIDSMVYENGAEEDNLTYQLLSTGLLNNKGVCDSYARQFFLLCNMCGIDCRRVVGNSSTSPTGENGDTVGHAWNEYIIKGTKFYADTTWGDSTKGTIYKYLGMTHEEISEAHTECICGNFYTDYISY